MPTGRIGAIVLSVILLVSTLIFAVMVLLIRLKTGRPFRSILAERSKLFRQSFIVAIVLLVIAALALIIHNNA
jgi:hypothetical protein